MSTKTKSGTTNQKNNIRYIYNTRKYLVWAGFLGLLTFVLFLTSLTPQINSISNLYNDLIKENKRLAQLKIKVAQLTDSANSLIVTNSDKVNQALPSKKPLLELLTTLNKVGNDTFVSFDDISLSPGKISTESAETTTTNKNKAHSKSTPASKYETMELDVTVTGKINDVNKFLREIEEIAPFSTVTAMSLNEKTSNTIEKPLESLFEAKITITTYFFTKDVVARIDTTLPELTVAQREIIDTLQNFTYITVDEQYQIEGGGLENLFPGIGSISI